MALTFPRALAVEAYLGEWTDVTAQVRQTDPIVVTRGGADEQPSATPGTFSCTMLNGTGNWTVDNPNGAYYGLLGRNTPIRYLLPHLEHGFDDTVSNSWGSLWTLVGTAANFDVAAGVGTILVPDSSSPQVAYLADYTDWSTYEVTVDVLLPFPTSGGALGCTSGTLLRGATASTGWRVALSCSEVGDVYIGIVDNGSFVTGHPLGVVSLGSPTWMRVRTVVEGNLILAKAWERTEPEPLDWRVSWLADTLPTTGWVGVRAATSAGATNTTITYDNFTVRIPRFSGEITSLTPGWDESHRAKWADLKASGIFLRLQQGRTPLPTAPERYFQRVFPEPAIYVPFDDGELALTPRTYGDNVGQVGVDTDISEAKVLGALGTGDLAPWLVPCSLINKSRRAFLNLHEPVSSGGWTVHFVAKWETPHEDASSIDYYGIGAGTSATIWFINFESRAGTFEVIAPGLASQGTTAAPQLYDGSAHHVGLRTTQVGSDIAWIAYVDGATAASGTVAATTNGSVTSASFINQPVVDADDDKNRMYGHAAIFADSGPAPAEVYDALFGHPGETAGRRAERLSEESDLPFCAVGDLDATAPMGPQGNRGLMELLQECADADQGVLLEMRGAAGVMFVANNALYNQTAVATFDYSAKQLQQGLRIYPDDKNTRNDITVERLNGSKYRAQQLVGPLNVNNPGTDPDAVGRYDESITVNVESDDQLPQVAHWRLHLGTNPESRCPSVEVELAAPGISASLEAALLRADVCDRLVVENLAAIDVYRPLDQLVRGYTDVLDRKRSHRLTFNTSPASPYDVFVLDQDRLGSASSSLTSDIAAAPSSFQVTTTDPMDLWTTAGGSFPFDIVVGGQQMTISAISGASSPQTFTVSNPSVNGVSRAWSADTKVQKASKKYLA